MVITTLQIWKSTWLTVTVIQITFYGELIVSLLHIDVIKILLAHFFKSLFTWKYILTDIVPCSRIPSSFFVNVNLVLFFAFSPCFFSDCLYDITLLSVYLSHIVSVEQCRNYFIYFHFSTDGIIQPWRDSPVWDSQVIKILILVFWCCSFTKSNYICTNICILIRISDAGRFKRFHQILSTESRFKCFGGQHSPRWSGWRRKI